MPSELFILQENAKYFPVIQKQPYLTGKISESPGKITAVGLFFFMFFFRFFWWKPDVNKFNAVFVNVIHNKTDSTVCCDSLSMDRQAV